MHLIQIPRDQPVNVLHELAEGALLTKHRILLIWWSLSY